MKKISDYALLMKREHTRIVFSMHCTMHIEPAHPPGNIRQSAFVLVSTGDKPRWMTRDAATGSQHGIAVQKRKQYIRHALSKRWNENFSSFIFSFLLPSPFTFFLLSFYVHLSLIFHARGQSTKSQLVSLLAQPARAHQKYKDKVSAMKRRPAASFFFFFLQAHTLQREALCF